MVVVNTASDTTQSAARADAGAAGDETDIGEVIDAVTTYAKQETIGRLKGAGSWLLYGLIGAVALGLGLMLALLGLLRLIQTEWDYASSGRLSWLPYLIVIVAGGILIAITLSRVKQNYLSKDGD